MKTYKSIALITLIVMLLPLTLWSQAPAIGLDSCLNAAEKHWPAFKKQLLITEKGNLIDESLSKNYLPQFNLSAQASYQSEVVSFPEIPNMPAFGVDLPLDNYNAEALINQNIWDGGLTKSIKEIQSAANLLEIEQASMDTYQLKGKIKQLYSNYLLLSKNESLIHLSISELKKVKSQIQASVDHGIILTSELDNIKAEQLKLQKQNIKIRTLKTTSLAALNLLTGLDLNETYKFETTYITNSAASFTRPELSILNAQITLNKANINKTKTQLQPKLMAFGKLGYGRPGYDFFNTDMHGYYMLGAKLSWDVWDWNKTKKQKQQFGIQGSLIELNQQSLNLRLSIEQKEFQLKIKQFEEQIELDKAIEILKEKVYQSAVSQFRNGSINSTDYLKIFNEWRRSKLATETDQLYLLQSQINYQHALGISK